MLEYYNEAQIKKSVSKIEQILLDKDVYNGQIFQQFFDTQITYDFTRKSLKRINVKEVKFINCSFEAAAGTGSKFKKSLFRECDFTGANFQDCFFDKCYFESNTLIEGANFSHSIFIECHFENVTIRRSTLFDCHFENCSFLSCKIYSDTTENSFLYNCKIKDVDLAHVNLEYMRVKDISMTDVKLPPYQVAYMIGAPTYLRYTCDKIKVYSDDKVIDITEYCELYPDLVIYYYSRREYFPLANILIALEKHEEAFKYIKLGINEASDYFDFRMIKHFCRLACSNENYSAVQLKELYNMITDLSYNNNWDMNTLHSYMINIGAIRELLLNNTANEKQRIEIRIKTNIDKDDLNSINQLYNKISLLIHDECSEQHVDSIELRHNSPYELFITCIDKLPYIIRFASSVYGILAAGNKFIDIIKNVAETQGTIYKNELLKNEGKEKQLDIEIKQLEIEDRKRKISKQNASPIYMVTEIEHNIKCNTLDIAKNISPEILHYKCKRENPDK